MTTPLPSIPSPEDTAWAKEKVDSIVSGTFAYPIPQESAAFANVEGIGDMTEEEFFEFLLNQWGGPQYGASH